MLSMAPVSSASGSAGYFAKDNYYSNEESADASMWYGAGAEMLGLAPGEALKSSDGSAAIRDTAVALADEVDADAPPENDPRELDSHPDGGDVAEAVAASVQDPSEGEQRLAAPDVADGLEGATMSAIERAASDSTGAEGDDRPRASSEASSPTGRVDPATFEAILNGKLPDGTQVGDPDRRALGMDLTFSAPKSVSIIGLVGGDARVIEANLNAVKAAMRFAEQHFAEGRVKQNGSAVPVKTGNLVYALFAHDTSRALDPQAHVHAVIANMTRMPNGQWRSLHNGKLWQNNTVIGSVYNAALRENLEKLGYTVELTGKHGSFEIVGVPDGVRDAFSQRRETILARASELGIASPEGINRVTINTRDPKLDSPDKIALLERWRDQSAALGFDPQMIIDRAMSSLQRNPGLIAIASELASVAVGRLKGAGAFLVDRKDPLLSGGAATLGLSAEARTELAVASGIRQLDQREAAFGVHALTKAALDRGLSGVTPETIATRVKALIGQGQLVPGLAGVRSDVAMLATREALDTERAILANIEAGQGRADPLVSADYANEVLRGVAGTTSLNPGQLAAATSIISSSDRIIAVQGIAGAGKSKMLGIAARALEAYGQNVLGLAFQNKMVGDLADGAGVKAQTLASFLMPLERMIAENDRAGLIGARKAMRNTVVVVDEASMVSNRQMASLTQVANLLELEKLVLVGDRQQLLSIDAGKSFALAQSGGIAASRMDENLRQRTDQMRTVVALANRGRASEALGVLGDKVISSGNRVAEASARWLALPGAERERTMVLTSGRETRRDLNRSIQKGLIADGTLKGTGIKLTVVEHVDRTREDMRDGRSYEPGLSLSLWGDEKSLGLKRGEYRIARYIKGGRVQLERDGKKTIIEPRRLSPSRREDRMTMIGTKDIRLYEGDRIRWTANDKKRGLDNSALGRVVSIDAKGVTFETADKSLVRLADGDPMLRRLDLAYALNMHMAQGVTTDKAMIVMGSGERFLSSQRLFNVGVTRARDGVTVITDDKVKLSRQLDRTPGDKLSALETTGQLNIDRESHQTPPSSVNLGPLRRDAFDDKVRGAGHASSTPASESTVGKGMPPLPPLPLPEKSKGLSL